MASIDRRVPATVGVVLLLALGVRLAGAGLHHPAAPAAPSVRKVAVAETPLALRVKSSVARPMDEVRLPAARDDARRLAADVETARRAGRRCRDEDAPGRVG